MKNFEDEVKKQIQSELEKMLEGKDQSEKTEEEKWVEAFSGGITHADDVSDEDEIKAWRDAFK